MLECQKTFLNGVTSGEGREEKKNESNQKYTAVNCFCKNCQKAKMSRINKKFCTKYKWQKSGQLLSDNSKPGIFREICARPTCEEKIAQIEKNYATL